MLTGKSFKLQRETVASQLLDGKEIVVRLPAKAIVRVLTGPSGKADGTLDVEWDGRTVKMFQVDLEARGEEVIVHRRASA
jgi:hypothetical protein